LFYFIASYHYDYLREHDGEWVLQCCSHGTVQRSSAEAGPGRSSAPPCLPYRCKNHAISSTLHPPPAPQTLNFIIWKIKRSSIPICLFNNFVSIVFRFVLQIVYIFKHNITCIILHNRKQHKYLNIVLIFFVWELHKFHI